MMIRLTVYAGSSVAAATAVLFKALHERANFYSACVYLSQSNASVIILVNLLVLAVGTSVFGLQRLLYGPLRPIEAEQLYDKAWFAVTETCLAMTMFREEIGVWFIVLFISLLVGKVWAWIGEGRVEILDQQPPVNPRLFHLRLSTSLTLSLIFDVYLLDHSIGTVRHQARPNMMVMFAFEFAVLTTGSVSTVLRYLISLRESAIIKQQTEAHLVVLREQSHREQAEAQSRGEDQPVTMEPEEQDIDVVGWEDKGRWVFYLELFTDLVRLILYLTFFCVLCVFYGMPIHIIRDVAIAIRSFYKRITDFVKYKHATRDMNERYLDATADDIGGSDLCIICREAMRPWVQADEVATGNSADQRLRPKKLPCGHILHFSCLRSWLERQQVCPTCRQPVLGQPSRSREETAAPQPQQHELPNVNVHQPGDAVRMEEQPQEPHRRQLDRQQDQAREDWRRFGTRPQIGAGAFHGQGPANSLEPAAPRPGQRLHISQPDATDSTSLPAGVRLHAPPSAVDSAALQAQVDMMEQQILQQIQGLRIVINQMAWGRASQDGIIRTHSFQNGGIPSPVQVFRNDSSSRPEHTGSPTLPQGLVLPEGWSLMRLRQAQGHTGPQNTIPLSGAYSASATTTTPTSPQSSTDAGNPRTCTNVGPVTDQQPAEDSTTLTDGSFARSRGRSGSDQSTTPAALTTLSLSRPVSAAQQSPNSAEYLQENRSVQPEGELNEDCQPARNVPNNEGEGQLPRWALGRAHNPVSSSSSVDTRRQTEGDD